MIPVVDTSEHQGRIDHNLMRARGVRGLILRATHGYTVDRRLAEHLASAHSAGFGDGDLGFYSFLNTKRGAGGPLGRAFVDEVGVRLGHLDTFLMYDAEPFAAEPGSGPVLSGGAYVEWLHDFDDAVRVNAPHARRLMYTNAAFWNPWTGGDTSFGHLDLIVARYPIYPGAATQKDPAKLAAWVASSPKPPADADRWDEWIMSVTSARPIVPKGWDGWDGWQFSAGFNRQGPVYGCQSSDLDLNIVRPDAWTRWTHRTTQHVDKPSEIDKPVVVQPPTPIPEGDEMQYRVNEHWYGEGDAGAPGKVHFELVRDHVGRLRYIVLTDAEWTALNQPTTTKIANDTLLALGQWQPAPAAAVPTVGNNAPRITWEFTGTGTADPVGD